MVKKETLRQLQVLPELLNPGDAWSTSKNIKAWAPPNDHYTPIPEILIQAVSAEVKPWFCCSGRVSVFPKRFCWGVRLRIAALGEGGRANTRISEAISSAPAVPWVPGHPSRACGAPPRRGGAGAAEGGAAAEASPLPSRESTARDSLHPSQREAGEVGKHRRPRGPNQRAVRRGGRRATQIGPSAPRLQGEPDITNPAGEEGGRRPVPAATRPQEGARHRQPRRRCQHPRRRHRRITLRRETR